MTVYITDFFIDLLYSRISIILVLCNAIYATTNPI